MKNFKSILFLSLTTLFFACQKEETLVEPGKDVTVTYSILVDGEATLDEVRFVDENLQLQTVKNPLSGWKYEMTVEEGFWAKAELIGSLPEDGYNTARIRIKGTGYGCWSANYLQQVAGDFHIETKYQMGED